jgi:hypothetical protein
MMQLNAVVAARRLLHFAGEIAPKLTPIIGNTGFFASDLFGSIPANSYSVGATSYTAIVEASILPWRVIPGPEIIKSVLMPPWALVVLW